jgi:ATP-dependent Clp protease ATP-binding subunit ClpA
MYEQLSDPAPIVMQRAEQLARVCKHEYIGTEHILLALVKEELGVTAPLAAGSLLAARSRLG